MKTKHISTFLFLSFLLFGQINDCSADFTKAVITDSILVNKLCDSLFLVELTNVEIIDFYNEKSRYSNKNSEITLTGIFAMSKLFQLDKLDKLQPDLILASYSFWDYKVSFLVDLSIKSAKTLAAGCAKNYCLSNQDSLFTSSLFTANNEQLAVFLFYLVPIHSNIFLWQQESNYGFIYAVIETIDHELIQVRIDNHFTFQYFNLEDSSWKNLMCFPIKNHVGCLEKANLKYIKEY